MKKRIRQALCIVSVLVLMCVSFVLPASADTTYPALTTSNVSDVLLANYKNILNKHWGTSDLACIVAWTQNSDNSIAYRIEVFDKKYIGTTVSYNGLYYGHIGDNGCETTEDIVNGYWNNLNLDFSNPFYSSSLYKSLTGQSSIQFHIVYSNIKIDGVTDIVDPNAPPVPFTVDYSPSLKTGLVRKGTLVAPGASNDGQEVETNTIAVTVKLTDAFLNASKPISGAYTYSYQFTCFVVPSEYKDSDIKTMSEHAIYTAAQDNLHYLYYENETLDVDDSLSSEPSTGPDMIPVSEQWANATGVSNCFLLERDSNNTPLRNVTIDLHNIDFEKHKSDSYNIVVLGHIVRKSEYGWTAYPSFFKSDCSSLALESTKEYPMNFGSTEQPVINKNFYDYYSVISDDWSFKDYPKFEPHKVGGVTVGDSPLDFKRTAKGVQDYNMWEQGGTDNTLKPDDFDKYKEQKKLDENFGSVDFGLDSIKSVFDGSSDFFKFLTASIGILPTTFLTILISFFVVMLAICVVKWVLK